MAIDKVRETHERWIKLALLLFAGVWLALYVRNGLHEQSGWLEISRDVFFPATTILILLRDFLPTPTFILTWCAFSAGLWLEAHGFRDGIAFYKTFSVQGWLFLVIWLFYTCIAAFVSVTWWRKRRAGDAMA